MLRSSLVFTFTYVCRFVCIGVSRCLFLKRHIARPHARMLHADVQKALPGQLDNKHRMVWHGSGIIYLASLLFSSMVFVKSEETICCPVIMGGQGGGDWKWGEQIKLRENGRRCPRTYSTFLPACSKSAILIIIPPDISWLLCVCVLVFPPAVCTYTPVFPLCICLRVCIFPI